MIKLRKFKNKVILFVFKVEKTILVKKVILLIYLKRFGNYILNYILNYIFIYLLDL